MSVALVLFAINVYNKGNMYKLLFEICFAAFADESKHLLLLPKIVQPRALIKLHEERVKAGNRNNKLDERVRKRENARCKQRVEWEGERALPKYILIYV